MRLWLLLIQILLQLVSDSKQMNPNERPRNVVPRRCQFMMEDPQVYDRTCHGNYPIVAFTKYRDTLITVGEPYSVYISTSLEDVMVVQKKSPLHDCLHLQFKDSNTFHCLDRELNKTLTLAHADMFCFPFHIQLPEDLINECLIQNQMTHNRHILNQVVSSKRTIIHYTYSKSGAQSLRILKRIHSTPPPPTLHLLCVLFILLAESSRKF